MTEARLNRMGFGFTGNIWSQVRRGLALAATLGVGAVLVVVAGIVAVTTAIVGVLIALAAMLLRAGAYKAQPATVRANDNLGNGEILDARRTARGWKVDR